MKIVVSGLEDDILSPVIPTANLWYVELGGINPMPPNSRSSRKTHILT